VSISSLFLLPLRQFPQKSARHLTESTSSAKELDDAAAAAGDEGKDGENNEDNGPDSQPDIPGLALYVIAVPPVAVPTLALATYAGNIATKPEIVWRECQFVVITLEPIIQPVAVPGSSAEEALLVSHSTPVIIAPGSTRRNAVKVRCGKPTCQLSKLIANVSSTHTKRTHHRNLLHCLLLRGAETTTFLPLGGGASGRAS